MDLRLFVSTRKNSPPPSLSTSHVLRYANAMLDEQDFRRKADAAFDDLKRRLLMLGDEHGFDVEGESGKLEVIFEEPEEAKFVISPNTPVREIWISALSPVSSSAGPTPKAPSSPKKPAKISWKS